MDDRGDPIWGGILLLIIAMFYTGMVIAITHEYTKRHIIEQQTKCPMGEPTGWVGNELWCLRKPNG